MTGSRPVVSSDWRKEELMKHIWIHSARLLGVGAVLVAMLLVAACGSDPTATPVPPDPTATPVPTEPTATPTPLPPGVTPPPPPTPTPVPPAPTATPIPDVDPASYFEGKTVRIQIGFSPGGGYDTFARLFAQFLPDFLPGSPRVVVQNLPGAGGIRGLQTVMRGPADGLAIGMFPSRIMKFELIGQDVADFDPYTVDYLGVPTALESSVVLYTRSDVATRWDEVVRKGDPITFGLAAPGHVSELGGKWIELAGGPIKTVYGYGGTSEITAAFDRGEIDACACADFDVAPRLFPEWIEDRLPVPILSWALRPEDDPPMAEWLKRIDRPVPPHIYDVWDFTDDEKALFEVISAINQAFSRVTVLGPGAPDPMVKIWQDAYATMLLDPEFNERVEIAGYEVGFSPPESILETMESARRVLQDPALFERFVVLAGELN